MSLRTSHPKQLLSFHFQTHHVVNGAAVVAGRQPRRVSRMPALTGRSSYEDRPANRVSQLWEKTFSVVIADFASPFAVGCDHDHVKLARRQLSNGALFEVRDRPIALHRSPK